MPLSFVQKTPIEKGWSEDKKYCVTDAQGGKYLLRVGPAEQLEAKKREFDLMKRLEGLGVPMCRALEVGLCEEGAYSLQSFVEGRDAEEALQGLDESALYAYGLEAGRILKKLHRLPAPDNREDWESFFNRKLDRKIERYLACPLRFAGDGDMLSYIDKNRPLLRGRPQCFQHGDYHIGNLMVDESGRLVVIDFNRCDVGDPWEEFNRIVWCAQFSPCFAAGRVDGYFDFCVPEEFFPLLALYISGNALSSMYWAIPFGEEKIQTMRKQNAQVLAWFAGMTRAVPTWYAQAEILRQKFLNK